MGRPAKSNLHLDGWVPLALPVPLPDRGGIEDTGGASGTRYPVRTTSGEIRIAFIERDVR
ncbi:MAG: hypothetical protein C0478_09115 [Planctomyces sp.]|nr:hypothetical protein [Planctomyces sp.]